MYIHICVRARGPPFCFEAFLHTPKSWLAKFPLYLLCMYVCIYIYIYIHTDYKYIYIYIEREREREIP